MSFRTSDRPSAASREWIEDLRILDAHRRTARRHHLVVTGFAWGALLGFLAGLLAG
jgi:ABC-type nitrate/sulfonate/bicarbonate transport system permease component